MTGCSKGYSVVRLSARRPPLRNRGKITSRFASPSPYPLPKGARELGEVIFPRFLRTCFEIHDTLTLPLSRRREREQQPRFASSFFNFKTRSKGATQPAHARTNHVSLVTLFFTCASSSICSGTQSCRFRGSARAAVRRATISNGSYCRRQCIGRGGANQFTPVVGEFRHASGRKKALAGAPPIDPTWIGAAGKRNSLRSRGLGIHASAATPITADSSVETRFVASL